MSTSANPSEPSAYPPSKTALLLLDYHNFLVDMVKPDEVKSQLTARVRNLVEVAGQNSVPVIHCLIGTERDPPSTSKMTATWENRLKPVITSQPDMLKEPSEFLHKDDLTFTRRAGVISAIKSEGILDFLHDKGVESLIMCGIATSGVVVSTARDATDLGYIATVVDDGCWDPSPDAHRAILETVLPMAGWVVDGSEGARLLAGKGTRDTAVSS